MPHSLGSSAVVVCRVLACWALACTGAGCADARGPDAPATMRAVTFIGELDEQPAASRARIAIVREGSDVIAYVCGQGDTLESHTRWFTGSMSEDDAELHRDGWTLHVFVDGSSLRGELESADDVIETWLADEARTDDSEVGLYRTRATSCPGGVIVWQAQPGPACRAQGAWCDESGTRGQVTPALCTADAPLQLEAIDDGATFELIADRVQGL